MKIANLAAVEKALQPFEHVSARTTGQHITLARTEQLAAHLGHPERLLRVVHVAGTSGKTSTAYYVSAMLTAAGKKVGLTVSPHVDKITERVQINGVPLSETRFCAYFGEFMDLLEDFDETPSRFEVLIMFAYWVFAEEEVDYAVIETGMGGLDDSTNVAARADKLCVITDIGLDHVEHLGSTIEKIAYQKAGIVHEGNTVLMYDQSPEIMRVVRYWVSQQEDAELLTFEQGRLAQAYAGAFVASMAEYQKRNWLLAFAAYRFLAKRDEFDEITATKLQKTQALHIPGRMDIRTVCGKTIIMDGAHNEQKSATFWSSYVSLYTHQKPIVLFALKQGKEIKNIATLLQKNASEVIVTTFTKTQDVPILSQEPDEIARVLRTSGVKYTIEPNQEAAYQLFLKEIKDVGVITGSFFLLAQLRESHDELK